MLLRHGHAEPAAAGDGVTEFTRPAPVAVALEPVIGAEVGADRLDGVADRELVVGEIEIHAGSSRSRLSGTSTGMSSSICAMPLPSGSLRNEAMPPPPRARSQRRLIAWMPGSS